MKVALVSTWVGFGVGVLGAVLSSIWPSSWFSLTCAFCFWFDFDATRTFVAALHLAQAMMNGSLYGLIGFTIGFIISKARTRIRS